MLAYKQFAELIQTVLKNQGYSEDVQHTSYDDLALDDSLPSDLRKFMYNAGKVWQYLIDKGVEGTTKEPVLETNNFICTPNTPEQIQEFVTGIPTEYRGSASIAIQMTINYINSKE